MRPAANPSIVEAAPAGPNLLKHFYCAPGNVFRGRGSIRREQGLLYLGLRNVVVTKRVEPPLVFRSVTVAELRSAMPRFDL